MSYQQRAKYKVLKRYLYKFLETMKFKTGHISNGAKVVLFGSFLVIISLFMTWVDSSTSGIYTGGAFSRVTGKPGLIIVVILGLIYFSLFSIQNKEKLKLLSNMYFKDYTSCILGGIFTILMGINSLSYIGGLQTFQSDIIAGKGPILCLSGAIILTIGGFIMKYETSRNVKGTFISESGNDDVQSSTERKNNMKLPF